jgi:hypothetical protein
VTVFKVKNNDEILGGYNPIKWESRKRFNRFGSEYSKTKDSFIFSFNKKDIKNHTLSRVKDENYSIDNYFEYGPSFGQSDLKICGNGSSFNNGFNFCVRVSFEKQIRKTKDNFSIEEYEVFQINIK